MVYGNACRLETISRTHLMATLHSFNKRKEYALPRIILTNLAFLFLIISRCLPTNEKRIKKTAPRTRALWLATFVILMVWTFSVNVVEPVPEPQSPASILQKPSNAIPLLTIPGVGGFELTRMDVEWYVPTCKHGYICIRSGINLWPFSSHILKYCKNIYKSNN